MIMCYNKISISIGLVLNCLILSGCGTTTVKPYLDVGLGYTIDDNSDWYLRTARTWTCDNSLTGQFEVGLELPQNWSVGYHHESSVWCGGPFNRKPELYQDHVVISKRFGGIK